MGRRMFAAVVPPLDVREELADFLAAREGLRWVGAERMHLTLAFFGDVPEHVVEPLEERLREAVADLAPVTCRLAGAGAFPHPDRPAVLWMGVDAGRDGLERLARRARNAGNAVGATPDGRRFVPHVTLARPERSRSAVRWLRVLDTWGSRLWLADEVVLVDSHLTGGGHRPRHETVARFAIGGSVRE